LAKSLGKTELVGFLGAELPARSEDKALSDQKILHFTENKCIFC